MKTDEELIAADVPALIKMLDEYQDKLRQVEKQMKSGLDTVLEIASEKDTDINNGISLIEVKYQVMLSYCIRMCVYLLLRLTGKSVNDHPLRKQQAHLRALIEKLRPIGKRIKYQVSQLLRTAAMKVEDTTTNDGANPLAFRPSPANLVTGAQQEGADDAIYRPPQLTPMDPEAMETKKKRKKEKMRRKTAGNQVIKAMREMISDTPIAISTGGQELDDKPQYNAERERYEEENFVRLQETKKDRARRKKQNQSRNALDSVTDLDDFAEMMRMAERQSEEGSQGKEELAQLRREKALRAIQEGKSTKKRKSIEGATDFSFAPQPKKKSKKKKGFKKKRR
eukprot:CAMPEP_0167796278 /NCGR_PEP_ID=MMETSP0111_2-20121227/14949_1 /TAXON_ID=91324 /ORGANISM="Lotharella globosa, Strain CCCM811" /LENGTH=338 /DNA_ID=CAMNT_0007690133 /DNA_START=1 /DNA_END=1017 /DNA_ORIENTATION=+